MRNAGEKLHIVFIEFQKPTGVRKLKNWKLYLMIQKPVSDKIEFEVATFGHDTPHHISTKEVYNQLTDCCKYDRKADLKAEKNGHQH